MSFLRPYKNNMHETSIWNTTNFSENIMPELNINQLENKITRISLNDMYNYKKCQNIDRTKFKSSCIKTWNNLSMDLKVLPYSSGKDYLHRALKTIKSYSYNKIDRN